MACAMVDYLHHKASELRHQKESCGCDVCLSWRKVREQLPSLKAAAGNER
jgi:hypothetical protein